MSMIIIAAALTGLFCFPRKNYSTTIFPLSFDLVRPFMKMMEKDNT